MKIHVLKAGENLDQISERFSISLDELLDANPIITQPEDVPVGIKVKIPTQRWARGRQVVVNTIEKERMDSREEEGGVSGKVKESNRREEVKIDSLHGQKSGSELEPNEFETNQPVQYGYSGLLPQDEPGSFDHEMFYNTRVPYHGSEWGGEYSHYIQENLESEHHPQSNQAPVPQASHLNSYEIQDGDTLWSICKKFGLNVFELQLYNPQIQDLESMKPGTKIQLPQPHAVPIPLKPFPAQPVTTQPYSFPGQSRYYAGMTTGFPNYLNPYRGLTSPGFFTPSPLMSPFMGFSGELKGEGNTPNTVKNAENSDLKNEGVQDPPINSIEKISQDLPVWEERTQPKAASMQIKRRLSTIERKILALEKQYLQENRRAQQEKLNRTKTKGLQPGVWNRPSH